ncbi:efflux RND transporter permease subunit [Moorena sp. SIO3I8]|uniref:efflux RND transporter permease subunit n=1 Tax=Moorena sp. SIO3I8 TaxID=2607833 RepID=UPI0013C10792|nr:efflux RND transporter permease subunit [Moorena sp. SIO3I8]NEO06835.1 efflux RND transporter permease subunit [Moorena sp. SIO3I8]
MSSKLVSSNSKPEVLQDKLHHNGHDGHDGHDVNRASGLAKFFFLKTVFGILLIVLLTLGGLMGYQSMVKEADPDVEIPMAIVTTTWPGADPETIETQVTDKIEKELKSLKGLKKVESASFNGFSQISVEFQANANVQESMALLRQKVDDAEPEINSEAEQPNIEQISAQDVPIFSIALYGNLDPAVVSRAAEDIQERLEKVSDVREVNLAGQRKEVINVQLIPSRMSALGISPTTVSDRLTVANQDMPWDQIENEQIGAQVRLYGRFRTLEDLRSLPITRLGGTDGRVVRLDEVALVRRDLEREKTRAFISWQGSEFEPTVSMDVVKVPGSDSINLIEKTLEELESLKQDLNVWPFGMDYRITYRQDEQIHDEQNNVITNVIQAVIGVFLILFIALTWREAIIAGLSIPLTFLGAIFLLWLSGYTLNNMLLYGMVIALGLLVDVFILMMEGMHDGLFVEGLTFNQAALKTVRTYAGPAFSGQLTTILAMAPLLVISGTMGKFIRLMPITAIICLLLSYAIALLIDIPLSRFLLGNVKGGIQKTRIDKLTESASEWFKNWSLKFTVRNRAIAGAWIVGTVVLFMTSLVAVAQLPGTLFPDADNRPISINVELPPTATLAKSQQVADDLGEILRSKDYFESVTKLVGQKSGLVQESGLKPTQDNYLLGFSALFTKKNQRDQLSYEYIDDLRTELNQAMRNYPGASLVINVPGTAEGGDPIAIELKGNDMNRLRQISGEVQLALRQIDGTEDVRDGLGDLRNDIKLRPKREAMDFYGISENDLALQGRYIMTDNEITDSAIRAGKDDLEIRLSTAWPSRNGAVGGPTRRDELRMFQVFSSDHGAISGNAILDIEQSMAPLSITHTDTERTVTVYSKAKGRTPGEILAELQPKLEQMKKTWSPGYDYKFGGEAETQSETFGSAIQMSYVSLFLVFSVLVLQFGSFTQPFIIMLSIPFALIGTFSGFSLLGIPLSFPTMIGIISLVGIVVNDSIVIVETMNKHRSSGMKVRLAAAHGASDRLRPVLTTSITTMVGLIPLALSDPIWFPLCMAIIFGLCASTLSALLVIPCLYLQLTPNQR